MAKKANVTTAIRTLNKFNEQLGAVDDFKITDPLLDTDKAVGIVDTAIAALTKVKTGLTTEATPTPAAHPAPPVKPANKGK